MSTPKIKVKGTAIAKTLRPYRPPGATEALAFLASGQKKVNGTFLRAPYGGLLCAVIRRLRGEVPPPASKRFFDESKNLNPGPRLPPSFLEAPTGRRSDRGVPSPPYLVHQSVDLTEG